MQREQEHGKNCRVKRYWLGGEWSERGRFDTKGKMVKKLTFFEVTLYSRLAGVNGQELSSQIEPSSFNQQTHFKFHLPTGGCYTPSNDPPMENKRGGTIWCHSGSRCCRTLDQIVMAEAG
jgi:hypothetical protein